MQDLFKSLINRANATREEIKNLDTTNAHIKSLQENLSQRSHVLQQIIYLRGNQLLEARMKVDDKA